MLAGFRKVRVFEDVTEATIDRHGNYVYIEVENRGTADVHIAVNEFSHQGHSARSIPVRAGTTRQIPMAVYNFEATGNVTVVAYGM